MFSVLLFAYSHWLEVSTYASVFTLLEFILYEGEGCLVAKSLSLNLSMIRIPEAAYAYGFSQLGTFVNA